jgi:hypothetical protein
MSAVEGGNGDVLGGGWCSKIKVCVVAATQRALGGWSALTSAFPILHHAHLVWHPESLSDKL